MREDQDKFIKQVRQQLDQEVDGLDGEPLSRLRQARAKALEAGEEKAFHWFGLGMMGRGAAAFASVAALAVAVWVGAPTVNDPELLAGLADAPSESYVLDDIELLAANEELDFYDDVEFYYWIETQDAG